jgi:hypothetical protein
LGTLALALGLLPPGARAGDRPTAQIDAPVPLPPPPPIFDTDPPHAPVVRAAPPEVSLARPVPEAVSTSASTNRYYQWRRPAEALAPPPAPVADAPPVLLPVLAQTVAAPGGPQDLPLPRPAESPEPPTDARRLPGWPLPEAAVIDGAIGPHAPACDLGGCGDVCCGCRGDCPPGNRWYVRAEYLLWWIKGDPLPPLVTAGGTGFLTDPNTAVEFGGSDVNRGPYSGARLFAGWWLDPEHLFGVEAGGFFLGSRSKGFSDFSFGNRLLGRPFIDATTSNFVPALELTASNNGAVLGGVTAATRTSLWGAEANLRTNWWCCGNQSLDLLAGFRMLGLDDELNITETVSIVRGPFAGVAFQLNDHFKTSNRFYGPQFGAEYEWRYGRWSLDVSGKIALGTSQQQAEINGATVINNRGTVVSVPGSGLLAQPTNDGTFTRDVFTFVPEVGVNVGYQVTPHTRAFIGYDFLYWNNVARAGRQIDLAVNTNQLATANAGAPPTPPVAGPQRPAFDFIGSSFWAQGLTLGFEIRY